MTIYNNGIVMTHGLAGRMNNEWYTLIAGDDDVIIDELKKRGYDVSSLMPQLEERKKTGKDKVTRV